MAESIVSDVASKIRNFEKNNYKTAKSVVPSESNKTNQEEADDRPELKKGKPKRILKPGMYLVLESAL